MLGTLLDPKFGHEVAGSRFTPGRKTLNRLMKMQPQIQKGLAMLARRRRQKDNIPTSRAGRIWINRKRPTQLTRVEVGESFTLRVSPHIIPDIMSVAAYLDMKAA